MKMPVGARLFTTLAVAALSYVVVFIVPAYWLTGDPWWARGWLGVALLVGMQALGGLWLTRVDPELLKDGAGMRPQKTRNKLAKLVLLISTAAWAVFIPIDVFYLHLIERLSSSASLAGGATLFVLGGALNIWIIKANSSVATALKTQQEGEFFVVDDAPDTKVLHPMYSSFLFMMAGLALMMGSVASAVFAAPVIVVGILPRFLVEEATLGEDFTGYAEYVERIRTRVIPFLF